MVEFSEGADSTRLRKYFKQADDKLKNCQIIYIIIQLEKDSGSYCDLGCRTKLVVVCVPFGLVASARNSFRKFNHFVIVPGSVSKGDTHNLSITKQ